MASTFGPGVVATSTVNRPERSRSAFIGGVMIRQLWLFWPSTISTRIFSSAPTAEPTAPATIAQATNSSGDRRAFPDNPDHCP